MKKDISKSKLIGIIVSYGTTLANALSTIVLTSIYLNCFGEDLYGLYQYIYSIAQYAMVMDLGISSVIVRHVSIYEQEKNTNGVENVLFYCIVLTGISAVFVLVAAGGFLTNLGFFMGTRPVEQYTLANIMLVVMVFQMVFALIQHYYDGILLANEQYVMNKGVVLLRILFKVFLILLLIRCNVGILSIAIGDAVASLICILLSAVFVHRKLDMHPRFHGWDINLARQMGSLMFALLLQSVVAYANRAVDKLLIGKMLNNIEVTIYSIGLTLANFFDEIPTVIQSVYLPSATKLVAQGATGEELTDFVIKPGRYQFILCGGLLGGLLLFGEQFIQLWVGSNSRMSLIVALLLIIPSVIPLIENVCLAVLTAKNKRSFRSYLYFGITILNFFLTIVLINKFGMIGAPIATSLALIVGNTIIMNVYYHKVIGINVFRLLKSIFKGIWIAASFTTIVCVPLRWWGNSSWSAFFIKCLAFCCVYAVTLVLFGLNQTEKREIFGKLHVWQNKV